jgi:anti-sigma factor RsiW
MRCDLIQEQLDAYWDDEVSAAARQEIERHLRICTVCRLLLDRKQRLANLLAEALIPPVPDSFVERVLSKATSTTAQPAAKPSRWLQAAPALRRLAAAIVLAAGVTAGARMGWQTRQPGSPPAKTADTGRDNPVAVYNLDYLGSTPDGSLPKAYLTLVASNSTGSGD